MSGTSPSRRTDPGRPGGPSSRRPGPSGDPPERASGPRGTAAGRPAADAPGRLWLVALAALLLIVYGYVAPLAPRADWRVGLTLALAVDLTLFALLIAALGPLRTAGCRALIVAAAAAAAAVALSWAGWAPPANVAKAVAAAGLGYWLAGAITSLGAVVLVACVSAVVDIVSVAWGPTKALIEKAPESIGYLTVVFVWPGEDPARVSTVLGVADLVFFALYCGAAWAFRLRPTATVAAEALAIAAAVVGGLWLGVMPALPWLAFGFLLVNADMILRRRGDRPGRSAGCTT